MRRSNAQIAENIARIRDDLEKVASPRHRKAGAFHSCFLQLGDVVRELSEGPSPREIVEAAKAAAAPKRPSVAAAFRTGEIEVNGNVIKVEIKSWKRV